MAKEFIGIEDNQCVFIGKVLEDPHFTEDGNYAFITLRATTGELSANGQWVDTPMRIPLMAINPSAIKTIQNHVKAERQLKVDCYYKSWTDGNGHPQHAFVIMRMKLGTKPYEPPADQQGGGPVVPPPNMG